MNAAQVTIASFFAISGGICVLRQRPDLLICLALVSLGFGNFWVYALGSIWSPIKIVGVWSVIYVLAFTGQWIGKIPPSVSGIYCLIWILVLLGCLLGYFIPLPQGILDYGGTQGVKLRPVIQLLGYIVALSFFALAVAASRIPGFFDRMLKYYAAAVIFVSLVGVYQLFALRVGLGFLPIYRINGFNSAVAAFSFQGFVVARLYSLAGEPKTLGIFLTPFVAIGLILFFKSRSTYPRWWNRRGFFLLAAAVDMLTYSTAVFIALAVTAVALWGLNKQAAVRVMSLLIVVVLAIGAPLISGSQLVNDQQGAGSFQNLVYERSFGRVESEYQKRNETAALGLIAAEPIYLMTGLGLGMYVFHLPGLYYGGGVDPLDSGWITILMDVGIFGILAFLALIWKLAASGLKSAPLQDPTGATLLRIIFSGVIASFALNLGTESLIPTMIWSGLAAAALSTIYGERRIVAQPFVRRAYNELSPVRAPNRRNGSNHITAKQ